MKLEAFRVGELYYIEENQEECQLTYDHDKNLDIWHRKLRDINVKDLLKAEGNGNIQGINLKSRDNRLECKICRKGKMKQKKHS